MTAPMMLAAPCSVEFHFADAAEVLPVRDLGGFLLYVNSIYRAAHELGFGDISLEEALASETLDAFRAELAGAGDLLGQMVFSDVGHNIAIEQLSFQSPLSAKLAAAITALALSLGVAGGTLVVTDVEEPDGTTTTKIEVEFESVSDAAGRFFEVVWDTVHGDDG